MMNRLEIGIGVVFLANASVLAWQLMQARHAPRGGRHLPAGLAPSTGSRRANVMLAVGLAVSVANAVFWLLRGFGRVR